jgi:hypothetical protein
MPGGDSMSQDIEYTRFRRIARPLIGVAALAAAATSFPALSYADENGVSFWLPGAYGSLAAVPSNPGFSLSTVYVPLFVSASGAIAAQREFEIGRFSPTVNVNLNVKVKSNADLVLIDPAYAFATPVFGGQLTLDMATVAGVNSVGLSGKLTAMAGPVTATRSGEIRDSVSGFGDLYPKATLRWNVGVNNFMTYLTGDVPVGAYDSTRLANLGIGHGAIDWGGGYTYLDQTTGREFSAVTGFTYNFVNPSTNYQSGVDWHLDWGASQFLSQTMFVGAVGYFYEQLSADRGSPPAFGQIETGVIGVGPQVGFIFPLGAQQAYLNFKAYKEFENHDRPAGWNAWVTLSISLTPPSPAQPVMAKN